MRIHPLVVTSFLGLFSGCFADELDTQEDAIITTAGPPRAPCNRSASACVDMYVAAHEDDDLLFMNPDVQNSIRSGNRVVTVYVTAGNLAANDVSYWRDREQGILDAYAQMSNPVDSWMSSIYFPSGSGLAYAARYDRPNITLIFLRLPDGSPPTLYGGGTGSTLYCNGAQCPSTSFPVQSYDKTVLTNMLADIMATFGATSVSSLDATSAYFTRFGDPDGSGPSQIENENHYYTARFALDAAAQRQVAASTSMSLRFYRGYTLNQDPANLSTAETNAKRITFAYYAAHDSAATKNPGHTLANPSFVFDGYQTVWPSRKYAMRTLGGGSELRGALALNGSCLGIVSGTPQLMTCNPGDEWIVTPQNQLKHAATGNCLAVSGSSITLVACTPRSSANTMFVFANGQIRTEGGKCLTKPVTSSLPTSSECRPRCIDETTGATGICPTDNVSDNPGAAGPDVFQDWTLRFTPVGLISTQLDESTEMPTAASYYGTFSIANRNICARRTTGLYCSPASGFTLGSPALISSDYTDATGWALDQNGSTVDAVWSPSGTDPAVGSTVGCGRGYYGTSCGGVFTSSFSTLAGWDVAPYRYGSIRYVDVGGDLKPDICGRASDGVHCVVRSGAGFTTETNWTSGYFTAGLGWDVAGRGDTIQFGDISGDGRADVCGRGIYGLECMTNTGASSFANDHFWSYDDNRRSDDDGNAATTSNVAFELGDYDPAASWASDAGYYGSIRLVDVNRDGFADVCSRSAQGIYCAFSTGTAFERRKLVVPFDFTDGIGWLPAYRGSTITYGDLDGDSRVDVCGRGYYGVVCAEGY